MDKSPNQPEPESQVNFPLLIERKTDKTKNELLISYNTSPIAKLNLNEVEKSNLFKKIRDILLSCNFAYNKYVKDKMFGFFKSLFLFNIVYFIVIHYFLLNFLYKKKDKEKQKEQAQEVPIWQKLLLFNVPELLIIFLYRKKNFEKINESICSLFSYLSERIIYMFNTDKKNNYLFKINPNDYNLYLYNKTEDQNKDGKNLYINNEELLSKDTFFNSVIAYPNANFEDFDFNNLKENEEKMFQDIFSLINDIEKKIKEDHKFSKGVGTFVGNLAYSNSTNFHLLYAIAFKIAGFVINEIYLNNFAYKTQRKKLIEEKTREFNHKNMENGYFLTINEKVILLFAIKDNYKQFDESYSLLYNDSENLLNHYFD